ncbi:hypothetical protein PM082_022602 [Marasmius tenuissimus]|nr:hypothetical protein PM082_022602 [Marasmius tenuissimus]
MDSMLCDMEDLVRESAPLVSPIRNPDTKRHATYFPPNFDLAEQIRMQELDLEDEHDETSSYIFRSPPAGKRMRKEKDLPPIVTPAQEIINQYRAGLLSAADAPISSSTPSESASSSLSPSTTLRCSTTDDSTWYTDSDDNLGEDGDRSRSEGDGPLTAPKIRFRQSRFDALNEMRAEAMQEMGNTGVSEDHPLVCPRTGCRETLANVHALTYHLHLHDIDARKYESSSSSSPPRLTHELSRSYTCNDCSLDFATRRERRTHPCVAARSRSAPTSPVYAAFGSILSKITSLN